MDGLVDETRLPVGTIFYGMCTGTGSLGITRGAYGELGEGQNEGPFYTVQLYSAELRTVMPIDGHVEDSDIDLVYRPRAGRASYLCYTCPDNWSDPKLLDALTREFQSDLRAMREATGVDWLREATEPDLAGAGD